MKFEVKFVPSADGDLDYYEAREQKIILNASSSSSESTQMLRLRDVSSSGRIRLHPGNCGLGTTGFSTK